MQSSPTASLRIEPLSGGIGAVATGIDLHADLDDDSRRQLYRALVDHVALVVKDQRLDAHRFFDAGRLFGVPFHEVYPKTVEGLPLVQVVSSHHRNGDGSPRRFGSGWHTDHIDEARPPKFTMLYAIELFREGGSTGIADMRGAYDALPNRTKAAIERMQVVYGRNKRPADIREGAASAGGDRMIAHPLVRTHPDTGRKALYLHPGLVKGVVGMTPDDAKPLLKELVKHALAPQFVYNHRWSLGDFLLWDNRQTMHRANYDYDPADASQHRLLYRMMIEGERPH